MIIDFNRNGGGGSIDPAILDRKQDAYLVYTPGVDFDEHGKVTVIAPLLPEKVQHNQAEIPLIIQAINDKKIIEVQITDGSNPVGVGGGQNVQYWISENSLTLSVTMPYVQNILVLSLAYSSTGEFQAESSYGEMIDFNEYAKKSYVDDLVGTANNKLETI